MCSVILTHTRMHAFTGIFVRFGLHCSISISLGKPGSIFVCDSVWVFEAGFKNSVRYDGTGRRELPSGVTASGEEG